MEQYAAMLTIGLLYLEIVAVAWICTPKDCRDVAAAKQEADDTPLFI
jgi:hypothetical protein